MTNATFTEVQTEPLARCPLCDEPLINPNECNKCDWVRGYRHPDRFALTRRDSAAALLSLAVPGLGHIYKGHDKIALVMLAGAAIVSGFAAAFFTFIFPIPASPILLACYWAFVFVHAYAAEDLNPPSRDIIWKMVAMTIVGMIGATLTILMAFRFLHAVS